MATRAAQIIQAKTHTEHIPGWESEDGTLVTSIPSNEYLRSYHRSVASSLITPVPGKRHRCLRSGFPPANMRCNGDAMLPLPIGATHAMSSACAAPPMSGKVLAWSSRTKTRCWEIRHGQSQPNRAVAFARPVSFLTSCKQKISTVGNETSSYKMFETL